MSRRLRAAVAGTGFIGTLHARSARLAGARLVGVAASTPERSRAMAETLDAERGFESAERLVVDDEVDVVHICTPNHLHVPLAEAAIEAGKHVVCEKPLAASAAEARRLVELADRAGVVAAVPFVYRYYPTVREARERVAAGATGPIRLIHGSYLQDWLLSDGDHNWRVDDQLGGPSRAFADIGSHWCDLAWFVSAHRIRRVSARLMTALAERSRNGGGATFARGGDDGERMAVKTEDAAIVQFETDAGALGSLVVSQVSAGHKNSLRIEFDGAEETLAFDQEKPETLWCGRREAITLRQRDPNEMTPPAARLAVVPGGHPQGYSECFDAFVGDVYDAIASGSPPEGMPDFRAGWTASRIVDAVLESARETRWVEIPDAADRREPVEPAENLSRNK